MKEGNIHFHRRLAKESTPVRSLARYGESYIDKHRLVTPVFKHDFLYYNFILFTLKTKFWLSFSDLLIFWGKDSHYIRIPFVSHCQDYCNR